LTRLWPRKKGKRRKETERDAKFVELGVTNGEVPAGRYWCVDGLKTFEEFLQRNFPECRRNAYYLMSIHENLGAAGEERHGEAGLS
jgi:hypothetical protein